MIYGHQATLNPPPGGIRYVGDTQPQENRAVPIHVQLEDLGVKLQRLHETLDILQQRLSCVCDPRDVKEERASVSPSAGNSGVSRQLTELASVADAAGYRVRGLIDSLEI